MASPSPSPSSPPPATPAPTVAVPDTPWISGEWGPLAALQALLVAEEQVGDGERDRKQTDQALARQLGSDELQTALQAASVAQLDLALAHDALAVERKPHSLLSLLATKAGKMEQWRMRHVTPDTKADFLAAAARFLGQISQFLYQYSAAAVELEQSIKTIFPLKAFLRRFSQHGHSELTPLHGQFFFLCLHAKCYAAAMEILDQPLFEIHAQPNLVGAVDFESYAYYGGLLYVGQKRFQEALDFFTLAITAPAVALSAFVVEAYKKLVLVSLILTGEPPVLPKYTPFVVSRHVEAHCSAYAELAKAFKAKELPACVAAMEKHAVAFARDANLGLVKQSLAALREKKLLQLTRTYMTIALAEMAAAAGWSAEAESAEAEKALLGLVAKGRLRAVVDQQRALVRFVLDEDAGVGADGAAADSERMRRLQREMQKLLFVSSQLRTMDAEVVTSAKFQSRLQKDKDRRRGGNQQGDAAGGDTRLPLGAGGMDIFE
ncbi:hypothetical protein PybrP1_003538 [[Pythium] brassicae (nom. inval.)]|nr:hypothetical protein PybrP1_003538 [[Pythium] brassicae (nom. inval.)]